MLALPTKPITPAQDDYNRLAEDAFQRLIQARNKGDAFVAAVALTQYKADINHARHATGANHFMLVNAER